MEKLSPRRIGNIYGRSRSTCYSGNVWDVNAISPSLTTMQGGRQEPMIITDDNLAIMEDNKPQIIQIGNLYPDTENFKNRTHGRVYSQEGLSPTLRTRDNGQTPSVIQNAPRFRIRKLTPRECFRLMDVPDHVTDKIQAAGISNTQQYKMAGNSIVVACLYGIFEQLFYPKYTNSGTLF